jgi:hypothetical protein
MAQRIARCGPSSNRSQPDRRSFRVPDV